MTYKIKCPKVFLGIIIAVFGLFIPNYQSLAQPTPTTGCDQAILEQECKDGFSEWQNASHWMFLPNSSWFCFCKVYYRWRECNTFPPHTVQVQIMHIQVDLSYKIKVNGEWRYPCREAIKKINNGSLNDISIKNTELTNNLFKMLTIYMFDIFKKPIVPNEPPYALCDPEGQDPNNPNLPPVKFIAYDASCMGSCRVQRPPIVWELPTVKELNEFRGVGPEDDRYITEVARLNEEELADLNNYFETEINPYIVDQEARFEPIVIWPDAQFTLTNIKCTDDFCCLYVLTLCVDKDGNTVVNEKVEGNIPECIGYPDHTKCPKGFNKRLFPCVHNCKEPNDN